MNAMNETGTVKLACDLGLAKTIIMVMMIDRMVDSANDIVCFANQ